VNESPVVPVPAPVQNDSYGFIVDAPPVDAKPIGDTAPSQIATGHAGPPPLPGQAPLSAPPPLPVTPNSDSFIIEPKPASTDTPPVAAEEKPPVVGSDGVPVFVEEKPPVVEPAPGGVETKKVLKDTAAIVVTESPDVSESRPVESQPVSSAPPPLLTPKPAESVEVVSNGEAANNDAPLLIRTQGLVKQYGGRRVVNGVDINVRAGEVVGLLGKNGAGKTTTFYMIVGLVPPTLGHVYMGDEDVTHMPMYRRARRGIGYLPQEESIFRKLTVEENLLAVLETLPMTEDEREIRCDELLKDFGLEHVRENVTITLSGGEKRRVTIARALVTSPTLLLLDEPFSGVDPMAVHDIQEIILHLKERGLGVLITDHNVRETLSVVDRAYIIDEGRVLSTGTREFLLNDPIAREIYLGHRFSM
jgi:lipopolysaccharide export system ATP-binding protein